MKGSKFKKRQILMLLILAAILLFVTPFLSSSLRSKYLFFIINLLIIALLGTEAGILSTCWEKHNIQKIIRLSGSSDPNNRGFFESFDHQDKQKKHDVPLTVTKSHDDQVITTTTTVVAQVVPLEADDHDQVVPASKTSRGKKGMIVEKSAYDQKIIITSIVVDKVKKLCPSLPSLFFIGGGGGGGGGSGGDNNEVKDTVTAAVVVAEEEEEETGGLTGLELSAKAEIFIGNFYKQLKMQRQKSWNRINGFG